LFLEGTRSKELVPDTFMSLRTLILCMLMVCLGCAGAEGSPEPNPLDASATEGESLEFVTATTSLLPNRMLDLSVRFRNADGVQANVLVDFSLVGAAAGASLSPTKVTTALKPGDAEPLATTTLRAGSTASDLEVRARAGANAYAYLKVSVRPALGTRLMVNVNYTGVREIASYTVTSLPNMTCAQALSAAVAGESVYHFNAPDSQATFDVGYDLSTALVGWGKDETGSKLVRGCKEFKAPVVENADQAQAAVTLDLQDIDLTLTMPLEVEMEVNASAAVRRFTEASNRAVAALVSPNYSMFADADYLLDAVQTTLTAQGNAVGAAALATRRSAESLAASLQPALNAQMVGPTAYGEATGQELARRGASMLMRWTTGAELSALTAQSVDGSETLAFTSLPLSSIVTRFDPVSAALAVDQLRVQLGLGTYGKTLLASLDDDSRTAGCASAFASWWSKSLLTDVAPVAEAQAACVASLSQLDGAIDSELAKLDATSTALQLAGAVPVHAREDDGMVDDLGPGEIAGSWGDDVLQAALQSPQRTAFQ
jgi:hypothetical protein